MVEFLSHHQRSVSDILLWTDPSRQPDIRCKSVKGKETTEGSTNQLLRATSRVVLTRKQVLMIKNHLAENYGT